MPDLFFVCRAKQKKFREYFFDGPADLAVEIVSLDSVVHDYQTKYNEYEQAGVAEYWIVNPLLRRFDAYSLRAKKFQQLPIDDAGRVYSKVLRGLYLKPAWLWKKPLPKLAGVMKELGLR